MRLPSIDQIVSGIRQNFVRFPFSTVAAVFATIAALILTDHEDMRQPTFLFPVLLASAMGFFLCTALALTAEKMHKGKLQSLLIQAFGAIAVIAYGFAVPTDLPKGPALHFVRYAMLMIGVCFFLMVAPYWRKGEINGFWQYNKTIFLRALTAALFAGVLFAGLAIALAALDNLFGVDIPGKRYAELWILIVGLFTTTFFLTGIPNDLDSLDSAADYPRGLRMFAQYVLLSLVAVYFVILYAYIGKILLEWNWPKGWVAELILGFTVTGVISLVLLYPIRELSGNTWMKRSWNWFFLLLIPLTVVLFLAIDRRISEYGITEERYIVFAFGVWLCGMIAYFLLSKVKSIKIIPASICLLAFLMSFGPWGAFAVSENSQVGRLREFLTKNEILDAGKVRKAPGKVAIEDARQISSIVNYMQSVHGYGAIQPWFTEDLNADTTQRYTRYDDAESVLALMGVPYFQERRFPHHDAQFFSADLSGGLEIAGYDHALLECRFGLGEIRRQRAAELHTSASASMDTIRLWLSADSAIADTLAIDIRQIVDSLATGDFGGKADLIPSERMCAVGENHQLRVKLYLRSVYVQFQKDKNEIKNYIADILYSRKTPSSP